MAAPSGVLYRATHVSPTFLRRRARASACARLAWRACGAPRWLLPDAACWADGNAAQRMRYATKNNESLVLARKDRHACLTPSSSNPVLYSFSSAPCRQITSAHAALHQHSTRLALLRARARQPCSRARLQRSDPAPPAHSTAAHCSTASLPKTAPSAPRCNRPFGGWGCTQTLSWAAARTSRRASRARQAAGAAAPCPHR